MVYVDSDGNVHQDKPWGLGRLGDIFWGGINFITLFFRSLFGLDRGAIQSGGGRSGRPNDGPPKGPKRMGGITTIQDCTMPGGG